MCWRALVKAAVGTSTVLVILGAATIFAWIVADLQVSRHMAELMFAISREPWAFLLMLNICLLVVGLFLEPLPAMIIMVPIFFPIAADLGIDPIHFGLIVVFNLMIGLCTPPVGVLIYMSAALAETSLDLPPLVPQEAQEGDRAWEEGLHCSAQRVCARAASSSGAMGRRRYCGPAR
jgi:TRAP-type C4-dicarboxylate transport system permease large subunit